MGVGAVSYARSVVVTVLASVLLSVLLLYAVWPLTVLCLGVLYVVLSRRCSDSVQSAVHFCRQPAHSEGVCGNLSNFQQAGSRPASFPVCMLAGPGSSSLLFGISLQDAGR